MMPLSVICVLAIQDLNNNRSWFTMATLPVLWFAVVWTKDRPRLFTAIIILYLAGIISTRWWIE